MSLEARHVYYRYRKDSPWILNDFTMKIEPGERVALFGPSGCGKTTLGLLLAGYLTPAAGEILCGGNPLPKKGACPVQMIWQHPEQAINPRWKLAKMLEEATGVPGCAVKPSGRSENGGDSRFEKDMSLILSEFGIESEWLGRYPRELSGGELQRFCVLRAMLSGASYLVCDEISTMLDVITQAQIWNTILKRADKEHMGILAITHNRHLAEKICDRVIEL